MPLALVREYLGEYGPESGVEARSKKSYERTQDYDLRERGGVSEEIDQDGHDEKVGDEHRPPPEPVAYPPESDAPEKRPRC